MFCDGPLVQRDCDSREARTGVKDPAHAARPGSPLPTKGAHSVSHLLREVCRSRSPRSLTTETNFMPTPFRHFGTPVGTRTATRTAPKVYPSFWRAGNAWCGGKLEPLAGGWKNSYPKLRGFSRLGGWLSELPRLVRWDCDEGRSSILRLVDSRDVRTAQISTVGL